MSKQRLLPPLAALLVLAAGGPVLAQNGAKGPELPVTRVVLFSSGVGYVQRDGQLNGKAAVPLHFSADQINDLLKTLIVQDGTGTVSVVQYDNRNPIDRTLKSYALDLTGDPTLANLLTQARGERVHVTVPQENGGNPIEGVIVGVEKQKQLVGKDQLIEVEQLNLLTDKGLISRPLARVERIEFVKAALKEEFRKALETLAAGRDRQKKTVTLQFAGAGKRTVSVGYLVESPVWKTTYRLAMNQGKLALQGWAVVENTTDEDWTNVRVGLVEGRPISFRMDLYEPLFAPRPLVTLERFAGLVPQTYSGEFVDPSNISTKPRSDNARVEETPPFKDYKKEPDRDMGKRTFSSVSGTIAGTSGGPPTPPTIDLTKLGGEAAATAELGDFFQYEIKEPVSLARQKSALLPIFNQAVEGKRVSIYNEHVQAKYPMLGLLLKNNSKLHLMQGPVTVYEDNSYAGDALLPDLRPGEERLLSFAVDLGVEVVPGTDPKKPATENLVSIKVAQGILHATYKQRQTRTYKVVNRTDQARDVIVEHPKQAGWALVVDKKKAPKETRDAYRLEVAVAPGKTAGVEVTQEALRREDVVLTNSADDTLLLFISQTNQDAIRKELAKAMTLKAAWAKSQRAIEQEREALATLEKNQARLRENLKILEKTSDLYRSTMKRFEAQENEFDKRQARVAELQTQANQQRTAYEEFIQNLKVE
jgi:hypothetical protein